MISKMLERSSVESESSLGPEAQHSPRPSIKHRLLAWLVFLSVAAPGAYYGIPKIRPWLATLELRPAVARKAVVQRTVPVVTATATKSDMQLYLNGLGTVTAFNTVTIRSRVDGELVKIAFDEGQMVRRSQLLAEIDPRPYQVQLADAEAALARDQATLKNAQLVLARDEKLIKANEITGQEWDAQVATVRQYLAIVKSDQAKIDNVKLQLVYCRITSPISGRIGLRGVDQGNLIRASDPEGIAVVTQLQPIALVFTIPQDDIVRVQQRLNSGDKLSVEAFDRDFKTRLGTGVLTAIDNQVDSTTGTVRLKAVFENKDNLLFPNQFVNARLLIDTKLEATIVPSAAVQRGPTSTYVYVVKSDDTVELRNVDIGPTGDGDRVAIEKGLAPGDVVVTTGVDKLQPGAKVATREHSPHQRGTAKTGERPTRPSDHPAAPGDPHVWPDGGRPGGPGGGPIAKRPT